MYDDRYLVFDTDEFESDVKEVRRMASDIAAMNGLLPIRLRTINRWPPCPLMPQIFRPATCLGETGVWGTVAQFIVSQIDENTAWRSPQKM